MKNLWKICVLFALVLMPGIASAQAIEDGTYSTAEVCNESGVAKNILLSRQIYTSMGTYQYEALPGSYGRFLLEPQNCVEIPVDYPKNGEYSRPYVRKVRVTAYDLEYDKKLEQEFSFEKTGKNVYVIKKSTIEKK